MPEKQEPVKIVCLEVTNVKRLKAVRITPDGRPLVCIGGRNGQGKTSVLDGLTYVLGGKPVMCERPVRDGAESADICLTLSNGLKVERVIRPGGKGSVTVSNGDGARFPSPQAVLDGLYGELTLDPLEFMRQEPKAQAKTLREMVGLDLSALDGEYQAAYDQRREVNRDVDRLKGQLSGMPAQGAPAAEVGVSALAEQLQQAERQNAANAEARREPAELNLRIEADRRRACQIEEQIATLQAQAKGIRQGIATTEQAVDELSLAAAKLQDVDTDAIRQQIVQAEAVNTKVRANRHRATVADALKAAQAQVANHTMRLVGLDGMKADALAAVTFPVPGLAFSADGVTYNNIPLEQCSSAEQLHISVAMAFAMNPQLKIALIRDGSLLDDDSLALVADLALAAGGEVWIERVGKGAECSVIIEDGEVIEDRTSVAAVAPE